MENKYIFKTNTRNNDGKSEAERHSKIIECLKSLNGQFSLPENDYPVPEIRNYFCNMFNLTKRIKGRFKGDIIYSYRTKEYVDIASSDDSIWLELREVKFDYEELVDSVAEKIITAFDAYSCVLYNDADELTYGDNNRGYKKNSHEFILRFNTYHFMDEELCKRALQLSPLEVAAKLQGHIFLAKLFLNGVIISNGNMPPTVQQSIDFDLKVRALLDYKE